MGKRETAFSALAVLRDYIRETNEHDLKLLTDTFNDVAYGLGAKYKWMEESNGT